MKKIIFIAIISILLTFTFSFTSKAVYPKSYTYEEVDFIYNVNFTVTNYNNEDTYIELAFTLQSRWFIDNQFLQDEFTIRDNTFFYMYNFEEGRYNAYTTGLSNPIFLPDNRLHAMIIIPKELFTFYYEEIVQVSELTFFTRFTQDYVSDVSEYFKLFVKAENKYDSGYEDGFIDGWNAKEEEINLELPALLEAEFQNGFSAGYDEGLLASQSEAYERGYTDGANESFIAKIDKWLVPAIIIVMLLGGYFAIARRKRDGDI